MSLTEFGYDNKCNVNGNLLCLGKQLMNTTQFIADCLAQTHLRLHATCEGLTAEQVLWRPAPTANNIGFILWHMGRHEDSRVTAIACGAEGFETDLWATDGWYERFGQPATAPDPGDRLGLRSLAIPDPPRCCCPTSRRSTSAPCGSSHRWRTTDWTPS